MTKSNLVDISCDLVHETDKAWLLRFEEDKDPIWIPKSIGELYQPSDLQKPCELTLPDRIAQEKGLI